MIRSTLKQVALAKGYAGVKQLTEALRAHFGVNMSASTLYPYWNDTVQNFNRETLDRLCLFLNVSPGLLIEHIDLDSLPKPLQKRRR